MTAVFNVGDNSPQDLNQWSAANAFAASAVAISQLGVSQGRIVPLGVYYSGLAKLYELSRLEYDWDGYGADAIDPTIVERASGWLAATLRNAPLPDLFPNSNGTLSFEWEALSGVAHLEIGTHSYGLSLRTKGGDPYYASGNVENLDAIRLGELVSSRLYPQVRSNSFTSTNYGATVFA